MIYIQIIFTMNTPPTLSLPIQSGIHAVRNEQELIDNIDALNYHNVSCLKFYEHSWSYVPSIIGELKSIKSLDLRNNSISKLPNEICNLDIVSIYLDNNDFSEIPEQIFRMPSIEILNCSRNNISNISTNISNLSSCKVLDLQHNFINLIPDEISKLPLNTLILKNNNIKFLPKSMNNLKSLRILDVNSNIMSNIQDDIIQLPELVRVDLRNNNIDNLTNIFKQISNKIKILIDNNPISI